MTSQDAQCLIDAANQNLPKLSTEEFLFYLELATYNADCKDTALQLIENYISSQTSESLEMVLRVEFRLAAHMLNKFDDQDSYSKFYRPFDKFYKTHIPPSAVKPDESVSGILFFVHSPIFLAHTNPLFQVIEKRKTNARISIASLGYNKIFTKKCDELGINFVHLKGSTMLEKMDHLEQIAFNHKHMVWQCFPALLSYFSARVYGVNWWSFKFLPPISRLGNCITSLPSDRESKLVCGNEWKNFTPSFEMKNRGKRPGAWKSRVGKIGAFCREQLIDDEKYWSLLSYILRQNKKLSFHYCGRNPIHDRWVKKFNIDVRQINFLGWLQDPQSKMLDFAILLDAFKLRHGLMGREAMMAGIPIIYPITEGSSGGLDHLYKRLPSDSGFADPTEYCGFTSKKGALSLVENAAFNLIKNQKIAQNQKTLVNQLPNGSFEEFVSLLENQKDPDFSL